MPIPELDPNGLVPPGVHEASLAELRERFGQSQGTDQRVQLQAALEAFVAEARGTGLVAAVIVNGSFASGQAQPGDIDLVVVLRGDVDLSAELRPDQYNVLSAKRVRSRYPFDVLFVTSAPETLQPAINFFAQVKGRPGLRKGMVRVTL